MDIRNFFSPKNTTKKYSENFTSITNKPSVNSKVEANNNRKKRKLVIDSDSDEEPIPSKKSHNSKRSEQKVTSPKETNKSRVLGDPSSTGKLNFAALKKHKEPEKQLKKVSSENFFKSPPAKSLKVKEEVPEELECDSDADFNKTLNLLDISIKTPRGSVNTNTATKKHKTHKEIEVFIDESPVKTEEECDNIEQCNVLKRIKLEKKYENCLDVQITSNNVSDKKGGTELEINKPEKETKTKSQNDEPKVKKKSESKVPVATQKSDHKRPSELLKEKSPKQKNDKIIIKKEPTDDVTIEPEPTDGVVIKLEPMDGVAIKLEPTAVVPEEKNHKRNFSNYHSYIHREGPQALGSKIIPEGQEGCLQGLTFIITGVLESMERDETKDLIMKYNGKVMSTLSKNTQYMVVGRDAGPAKLEKAEKLGTKLVNEDELLDLIRTRPGKKGSSNLNEKVKMSKSPKIEPKEEKLQKSVVDDSPKGSKTIVPERECNLMWVDKYKPTSLSQVIGQQGDRSCANKLLYWLKNWWHNNSAESKAARKKWGGKDDGSAFKAALLSGPPGVGKTTSAVLACKETGFEFIELNASDTRSKKCLQSEVSELLQNKTISVSLKGEKLVQKHVIIFDEVDGMSGNEDRGGTQELIALIKHSKIPVICICNDRQHPKIRSLANYCFDLRFIRPRVEQIIGKMMSYLHKEKIKLPQETLHEIITATNQDVRQVLHHLSFLSSKDVSGMRNCKTAGKDLRLGPFDVLKKVFSIEEGKASINEKASLFFHDYSLAPLFVQENYPGVRPLVVKDDIHKHLDLLSKTADSISYGDTIDRAIRTQNNWSLLPMQAIFASVIPGDLMRGYMSQMITFPSWLGKNSSRNHMDRVLQQLHMHTCLKSSGNKTELALDYLTQLRHKLTNPLVNYGNNGVQEVMDVMENYHLLREDLDSIVELSLWSGQKDPMTCVLPKTKAALTKALNKEGFKNPYSTITIKKGKKQSVDTSFDGADEDIEVSEDDADDLKMDAMVKQKKQTKASKTSESEESTSKGKGRGKGASSARGRGKK